VLTESVLGATAVDPGYATWRVKPHAGNVTWAQGQVPTRTGPLVVKWARDSAGQFHLQVAAPSGTTGEVWVPTAGTNAALTRERRSCGAAAATTSTESARERSSSVQG
jgi:hypothetical protein